MLRMITTVAAEWILSRTQGNKSEIRWVPFWTTACYTRSTREQFRQTIINAMRDILGEICLISTKKVLTNS